MADRLAVVTGGSRGIGRAVVHALADAGLRVLAVGRDREALEETAAAAGDRITPAVCDVTEREQVEDLFADLEVDVLVNNAGAATSATLERTRFEDWTRLMAINATAPFLCTRAVLPGMRSRDRGRIVFVASVAAHVGMRYTAAYAASKHAVVGLMRVTATEVAGTNITANAVCPGFVDTPMTEESIARIVSTTGRSAEEARTAVERAGPLGRLLQPEEVAATVRFLISEEAGAINGQSIVIDGGGVQL